MFTSTNQERIVQIVRGWRPITVTPPGSIFDWRLWVILPVIALGFGVVTGLWMGE